MPATPALELSKYCSDTAKAAKAASYQLASLDASVKNTWLTESAEALLASTDLILEANQRGHCSGRRIWIVSCIGGPIAIGP